MQLEFMLQMTNISGPRIDCSVISEGKESRKSVK